MSNQQFTNKPSAAYCLTLIGGILGLIVGFITLLAIFGIWLIVANIICITYAQKLLEQPNEHHKYGTYILILAIFTLNPFSFIGAILAITFTPIPDNACQPQQPYSPYPPVSQPTQYAPATTKYCPQCGNPVGGEAQYCPKCGTKLPQ
jgi:hypothetical protein